MTKFQLGHRRSSKLSPDQVLEIRRLYSELNWSQGRLAREFGMSVGQIGRIVRGEHWQEYTQIPTEQEIEHQLVVGPKPDPEELKASLERLRAKMPVPEFDEPKQIEENRSDDDSTPSMT